MTAGRTETAAGAAVGLIGVGRMGATKSRSPAKARFTSHGWDHDAEKASFASLGPGRGHGEILRWLEPRAGSEIGGPV